jgi:4-oxalocrotonate tautomerase
MPLVHIEIAEGYSPEVHRELHERMAAVVSELLTAAPPSIRICITEYRLANLSVGGVPLSSFGAPGEPGNRAALHDRPLVQVHIVEGRTLEARVKWHDCAAQVMAEVLNVPVDIVRTRVTEMSVDGWGIAGVPYSVARKDVLAKLQQEAAAAGQ